MQAMENFFTMMQTLSPVPPSSGTSKAPSQAEKGSDFHQMMTAKNHSRSPEKAQPQKPQAPKKDDAPTQEAPANTETATQETGTPEVIQQEMAAAMIAPPLVLNLTVNQTPQQQADAMGKAAPVLPQTVAETAIQAVAKEGTLSTAQQMSKDGAALPQEAPKANLSQQAAKGDTFGNAIHQAVKEVHTGKDAQGKGQESWQNSTQDVGSALVGKPLFQSVEHTPMKVGQAPVADTQAPDFEAQLVKQMNLQLSEGTQKVVIRLAPESLGHVTVEMTRSQDGALQVVLHASNSRAASLLTDHANNLAALLRGSNPAPVQVEVQQPNNSQYHEQGEQQGRGHHGQGQQQQQSGKQQQEDFMAQLRLGMIPMDVAAS